MTVSACTKKLCAVEVEMKRNRANEDIHRLQQQMPLLRHDVDPGIEPAGNAAVHVEPVEPASPDERAQSKQRKAGKKQPPKLVETLMSRQVRAVHGQGEDEHGEPEVWLYIPYNLGDKNETKRKGWWLYAEAHVAGHYYIGEKAEIPTTK